jgi:hypothetical protein
MTSLWKRGGANATANDAHVTRSVPSAQTDTQSSAFVLDTPPSRPGVVARAPPRAALATRLIPTNDTSWIDGHLMKIYGIVWCWHSQTRVCVGANALTADSNEKSSVNARTVWEESTTSIISPYFMPNIQSSSSPMSQANFKRPRLSLGGVEDTCSSSTASSSESRELPPLVLSGTRVIGQKRAHRKAVSSIRP